ncbi:uncharacterized protein [Aegilops tauschii subsp. strangulata]|uniref:uncharacterized protein n=1 Tax=Aegilops tauschii subsp. strangulata TaxID=200361 RepID=UPI001E1CA7E3|nr:uncharacterized protein LOC109771463 isoform X2 [Aegilops tauschii subsp. strangulata]
MPWLGKKFVFQVHRSSSLIASIILPCSISLRELPDFCVAANLNPYFATVVGSAGPNPAPRRRPGHPLNQMCCRRAPASSFNVTWIRGPEDQSSPVHFQVELLGSNNVTTRIGD